MRDGNGDACGFASIGSGRGFSLPMRDGNPADVRGYCRGHWGFSLPMRDGN